MTCPARGRPCASRLSHPPRTGGLKATSRQRRIAIDPEGLTVRDHCFTVNHARRVEPGEFLVKPQFAAYYSGPLNHRSQLG
jgi:hypothetical protein